MVGGNILYIQEYDSPRVQTLLVAIGNNQLPQNCLLLDLEAEEREEYTNLKLSVVLESNT